MDDFRDAEKQIMNFLNTENTFADDGSNEYVLSGFAGTGKTTLLKKIYEVAPVDKIMALTGCAVEVLKSKGIKEAQTIHRTIYDYKYVGGGKGMKCVVRSEKESELVLVDEFSMIGENLKNDILSCFQNPNIKFIYFGDLAQVEPVKDNVSNWVINKFLTKIRRNEDAIIRLASSVRRGEIKKFRDDAEKIKFSDFIKDYNYKKDIVISYQNKDRIAFNNYVRKEILNTKLTMEIDEKFMVLKNCTINKKNFFNGQILFAKKINSISVIFEDEAGNSYNIKKYEIVNEVNFFESDKDTLYISYSYGITIHKSQGKEFDRVFLLNKALEYSEANKNLIYTAVTRARHRFAIVT